MAKKTVKTVSIFIRLGLHTPHGIDRRTKLERIRTDSELCWTAFGTRKMIFLNKN